MKKISQSNTVTNIMLTEKEEGGVSRKGNGGAVEIREGKAMQLK